jgi:hypothetical protein
MYYHTKNPNLGFFGSVLDWKMLVYFLCVWDISYKAIWYIFWLRGIFYVYLAYFFYLGTLHHDKSGNPVQIVKIMLDGQLYKSFFL